MTPFQKMLKSHVWGYKAVERHWFAKDGAPRAVRVPSTGEQVTFRRALYAGFKGDVPEDVDLRSGCGVKGCLAPDHQEFAKTRTSARTLHIPDLDGIGVDNDPKKLPKGVTFVVMAKVRHLGNSGSSLESICAATGLDRSTVMKIRGGVYDRAVATVRRATAERRRRQAEKKPVEVAPMQPRDESDYPEVPEAEVEAWLRSIQ